MVGVWVGGRPAHGIEEAACVLLVRETDGQVIGIAHNDHVAPGVPPSPAIGPEIRVRPLRLLSAGRQTRMTLADAVCRVRCEACGGAPSHVALVESHGGGVASYGGPPPWRLTIVVAHNAAP